MAVYDEYGRIVTTVAPNKRVPTNTVSGYGNQNSQIGTNDYTTTQDRINANIQRPNYTPASKPVSGSGGSSGSGGGYSSGGGGNSGGGVSVNIPTYTEMAKPQYTSKYQSQIDELAKAILNREAFTYDHMNDPSYQQYEKSYTRMGNRAMEDTLGRLSGRTGGMASSYAGSVAQQTFNNYMSDLADIIPELRQLAYSMYVDEGNVMNNNLASLRALEDANYAKYRDDINDYNLAMERHAALQKAAVEAQAAAAKARSSSSYSTENALNYLVNSGVMDADTAADIYDGNYTKPVTTTKKKLGNQGGR